MYTLQVYAFATIYIHHHSDRVCLVALRRRDLLANTSKSPKTAQHAFADFQNFILMNKSSHLNSQ